MIDEDLLAILACPPQGIDLTFEETRIICRPAASLSCGDAFP